jgi:hypothetical protein
MNSILTSIKKLLGIAPEHTFFDADLVIHINSVLAVLTQMGIGPAGGFAISDDTAVWKDFLAGDVRLELVKSYVYMKVRLLFDPPINSAAVEAMKGLISEFEWRAYSEVTFV